LTSASLSRSAAEAELDHAVDGVDTAAADADDLDHGEVVVVRGHVSPASGQTLNLHLKFRGGAATNGAGPTVRVPSGC
jgi:flavin-binding protein dodecin